MKVKKSCLMIVCALLLVSFTSIFGLYFINNRIETVSAVAADDYEQIIQDKNTKVSNLPKTDHDYYYILSNLTDEPIKIPKTVKKDSNYALAFDLVLFNTDMTVPGATFYNLAKFMVQRGGDYKAVADNYSNYQRTAPEFDPNFDYQNGIESKDKFKLSSYGKTFGLLPNKVFFDYGYMGYDMSRYYTNGSKLYGYPDNFGCTCIKWDLTLNAPTQYIYIVYSVPQYVVTFEYYNENGVKNFTNKVVQSGYTITAEDIPSVPELTFANFTGTWSSEFLPVTQDIKYEAIYDYNKYTVTYLNNDGSLYRTNAGVKFTDIVSNYNLGSYFEDNGNIRTHYQHIGWTNIKGSTTAINLSTLKIKSDITLYPIYRLDKREDLTTGEVDDVEDKESQNIFEWIGNTWTAIGKWNIFGLKIGGFFQFIFALVLGAVGIFVIVMLVKLFRFIINLIKSLFKK